MKKTSRLPCLDLKDIVIIMSGHRQRPNLKRPVSAIAMVSLASIAVIVVYVYQHKSLGACNDFSSPGCAALLKLPRFSASRQLTDAEIASHVVIRQILKTPPIHSSNPKIAFMFLTPGILPFEKLWDKFFEIGIHTSRYFAGREIRSRKVEWGKISMVEAEKRLLAYALVDPDNQQFVLLSDRCIPLHNFDYIYNYLMFTNVSYIDSFVDPGPHGYGRFSKYMLPEIEKKDFRKGAKRFAMKRQHAAIVMSDSLYYKKFRLLCRPNMDGRNCYSDEHYLPTFFHMIDPEGIANWSVTHVDWSERKWHPKSYSTQDVTFELLKNISSINEAEHVTSDAQNRVTLRPCMWNGLKRPCYLFARKFYPETLEKLMFLFSNYTTV